MKLFKIFVRRKTGEDAGYKYVLSDSILQAKKLLNNMDRNKKLLPIRTFSDDPSSMKGDPLEDLANMFSFVFVCCGLGLAALVIKGIIYLLH